MSKLWCRRALRVDRASAATTSRARRCAATPAATCAAVDSDHLPADEIVEDVRDRKEHLMRGTRNVVSDLLDTSGRTRPAPQHVAAEAEQRQAARVVVLRAVDAAEARELLAMLGLDHLPTRADRGVRDGVVGPGTAAGAGHARPGPGGDDLREPEIGGASR